VSLKCVGNVYHDFLITVGSVTSVILCVCDRKSLGRFSTSQGAPHQR